MLNLTALLLSVSSCFTNKKVLPLPENADALIEEVAKKNTPPDWHLGKLDTVCTDELSISYESIGDERNPTVLLIMGYATPGLAWTTEAIQPLLDASYHVIRFDNRDTGKTRWKEGKEPKGRNSYDLSDMAKDACLILDKLGKDKVDIVGISMGGMIAQHLSLNHPERVRTLTCISSTGYYFDPQLVAISGKVITENAKLMLKYGIHPKSFAENAKKRIRTMAFLRNDKEINEEMVVFRTQRLLFKKQHDYVNHPKADRRHTKAIRKSGSRLDQLNRLRMPVLLIHGTKDVLIWHQHTEKYAKLIPNSKEIYIENMGHVPTFEESGRVSSTIVKFIQEQKELRESSRLGQGN